MPIEREIEDVKRELFEEIKRHLEDNVLGVMTPEQVFVKGTAFVESYYNDKLPFGFECHLINPRMDGGILRADGFNVIKTTE